MPVIITNLSSTPIIVPLNSGASLRVSPGTVSDAIPEVEVKDNPKIDKLLGQRVIAVEDQSEGKARFADAGASEPGVEGEGEPRSRTRKKS
jgi:hypothetical protein